VDHDALVGQADDRQPSLAAHSFGVAGATVACSLTRASGALRVMVSESIISGSELPYELGFATYSSVEFIVFVTIAILLICAHFVVYLAIARHREFEYLKSNAIGVDIDGVLNKHRKKFCEMAGIKLNKVISPDEIRVLPISDNKDLAAAISRSDERKIFNDPSYWTDMPELEGAADAIRSIRSAFLLPVHVFTHRPWRRAPGIPTSQYQDLSC
jgi:hypothetical protein